MAGVGREALQVGERFSEETKQLATEDAHLKPIIARVGPTNVRTIEDGWAALVGAIVHQQISGKAAATICGRLEDMGNGAIPPPERLNGWDEDQLADAGLSPRKIEAIQSLGRAIVEGELALDRVREEPPDEAVETLTRFKGLGPWTAKMWLIFHARERNLTLPGDLGLRKAIRQVYGMEELPTAAEVRDLAERWSPVKTVATWYLWQSLPDFPTPGIAVGVKDRE